ncbi:MAG TPA: 30S ribosomal protein S16 [Candidatus Saccharimonadales bacterium]|nr:30S ribosomal protein S16 [Candidatus Saccharimonadales bacterium]
MLAIRMQRTGRSGHAQFRVIVQDSRFSPKRGRVVAYVGSYDPHTKTASLNSQEVSRYLQNGAQPSDRVVRLLKKEGIKLPGWVKTSEPRKGEVRNPDKRRSTRPPEPKPATEPTPTDDNATESEAQAVTEEPVDAAPQNETAEDQAPAQPAEETETTSSEPAETENKPSETSAEKPAAEDQTPQA